MNTLLILGWVNVLMCHSHPVVSVLGVTSHGSQESFAGFTQGFTFSHQSCIQFLMMVIRSPQGEAD